jgi:mannose-6-phosphate isomerase
MNKKIQISLLKNQIKKYQWGSKNYIQNLLEIKNNSPLAEIWMGEHPSASSQIKFNNEWTPLNKIIDLYPKEMLGENHIKPARLPFLFKVLAADDPLSIQIHPSKSEAIKGHERENDSNISLNAFNRNYKDKNHKPECLVALTEFNALAGFRKIKDIIELISNITEDAIKEEISFLKRTLSLEKFIHKIFSIDKDRQKEIIDIFIKKTGEFSKENNPYYWFLKLSEKYPSDITTFSPFFFNLTTLFPGEGIFIPSGLPHLYLSGTGVELMSNSDNVLRGGCTNKYIDIDDFLKVIDFKEGKIEIIKPNINKAGEKFYNCPVEEFLLSSIEITREREYKNSIKKAEIILCIKGNIEINYYNNEKLILKKGDSIFIPAIVKEYIIKGDAFLYKAAIP